MIIKCPECGKDISDEAKQCIHCGFPIQSYFEKQRENMIKSSPYYVPKAYRVFNVLQKICIIFTLIEVFLFLVFIFFAGTEAFNKSSGLYPVTVFFIIDFISCIIEITVFGIFKYCFRKK